jgi:predicted GNAT family acetyltransferase
MIANVAVHPDYRGRGIARALMATAIENGRSRGANAAMLQVREDNPIASHLYYSLGFVECARRTTWQNSREYERFIPLAGTIVGKRRSRDWAWQRAWLGSLYPVELRWHIPLNMRLLKPGLEGILYRFFSLDYPRHWSVYRQGQLAGVLTHQETDGYGDMLWLAAPEPVDEQALRGLLAYARQRLPARRPLALNLPAGLAPQVIREAGFFPQQTLIWMEYRYPG